MMWGELFIFYVFKTRIRFRIPNTDPEDHRNTDPKHLPLPNYPCSGQEGQRVFHVHWWRRQGEQGRQSRQEAQAQQGRQHQPTLVSIFQ